MAKDRSRARFPSRVMSVLHGTSGTAEKRTEPLNRSGRLERLRRHGEGRIGKGRRRRDPRDFAGSVDVELGDSVHDFIH